MSKAKEKPVYRQLVWRDYDQARQSGFCYFCDERELPAEQRLIKRNDYMVFLGFGPGPNDWARGHGVCSWRDERVVDKPDRIPDPLATELWQFMQNQIEIPEASAPNHNGHVTEQELVIVVDNADPPRGTKKLKYVLRQSDGTPIARCAERDGVKFVRLFLLELTPATRKAVSEDIRLLCEGGEVKLKTGE